MSKLHSYEVQVRSRAGEVSKVFIEAESQEALYKQIAEQHLVALDVKEGLISRFYALPSRSKVKKRDVQGLLFQMGTYLRAGLPLAGLLELLSKRERNEELRYIMVETHRGIRSGKRLSELLGLHPTIFPNHITASLKAGEESGNLAESLLETSHLIEKEILLRDALISSLTYPVILLITAVASIFLIIYFAVPRFAQVFADMGKELPVLLALMFQVSKHFWLTIAAASVLVGGSAIGMFYFWQQERARQRLDAIVAGMPRVGQLVVLFQLTLFFRTLGMALRSALPVDKALELANSMLSNRSLKEVFNATLIDVRKGGRLTATLDKVAWIPEVVTNLMGVAEESGSMDEMSIKVSEIMEEDLDKRLKRLVAVAEPLMILGVSLIIGGVVISLLYSLFSINF